MSVVLLAACSATQSLLETHGKLTIPALLRTSLTLSCSASPPLVPQQLTLQCVPRHQLEERTITTTAAEVKKNHKK